VASFADSVLGSPRNNNLKERHLTRSPKRFPGGPIYYEFSTPEELRLLILRIDELRELVRPRRVRILYLPMREKFTGRFSKKHLTRSDDCFQPQNDAF